MKKICCILAFLLLLLAGSAVDAAGPINRDGYFKNIRLAGRVRVVDSFPDDIGEWQFVDYGEDFTIQFVDSFPDIRIEFVDSFPGVC